MSALINTIAVHPLETAATTTSAVLLLAMLTVALRWAGRGFARLRGRYGDEYLLTLATAAITTGVAAQGMWIFFGTLNFSPWLRVAFFAFLELMVITSAIRARASSRDDHGAGADGIAMWAFTGLSAVLAATHATSAGEVLFRLATPLAAAWGWERCMKLERRRRTGKKTGINWKVTPERILVKLGLADPTGRSTSEAEADRRLMRLAVAATRARTARRGRHWLARRRVNRAMVGAVEYANLGVDSDSKDKLWAYLGALVNASDLITLEPVAPWQEQPPAVTIQTGPDGLSEVVAVDATGEVLGTADLSHLQTPVSGELIAGRPVEWSLNATIRSAKADGLSFRDIADAYEITRYRVEQALKPDREPAGPDASAAASEPSDVRAPEPVEDGTHRTINGLVPARLTGDQS